MEITTSYTCDYEQVLNKVLKQKTPAPASTTPFRLFVNRTVKRGSDVLLSSLGLLIISPCLPFIYWKIKRESSGPGIYRQERLGKEGKPFQILKFRTMYVDAEKDGPALSSADDARVTPFGRFLRRWRIDEFPQFINVLKGDMSLIGPRPERRYYIDQLAKEEPAIFELFTVRPGITSLGQVLFGYAENKTQMLQRVKLELFYLRNYSLALDLRIFIYTIRTLLKAEGK
ncbi:MULTISPECIES: sugar transferase [unclassified Carboxylicivirga]|uniref:sugar transferase n=1 Tax=Carboxylicivirga TaxID=1628153 RepID=UPI003D32C872